jgi:hypothetical protein
VPDAASIQTYIAQWLKTATSNGVTAVFAWGVDRMELECHHCGMKYTSDIPKDVTTNDYGVQSFVQQHLHRNSQVWYNGKSWQPLVQEKDEMTWKAANLAKSLMEQQQQQNLQNKKPLLFIKPPWDDSNTFITNESPAKKDWAMVDGKKIYRVRDKDGKVVGVSDKPNTPPPVKKVPKESEGRKFR